MSSNTFRDLVLGVFASRVLTSKTTHMAVAPTDVAGHGVGVSSASRAPDTQKENQALAGVRTNRPAGYPLLSLRAGTAASAVMERKERKNPSDSC